MVTFRLIIIFLCIYQCNNSEFCWTNSKKKVSKNKKVKCASISCKSLALINVTDWLTETWYESFLIFGSPPKKCVNATIKSTILAWINSCNIFTFALASPASLTPATSWWWWSARWSSRCIWEGERNGLASGTPCWGGTACPEPFLKPGHRIFGNKRDSEWFCLMLIDFDWFWLILIDSDWFWLMLIDSDWRWLILT